MPGIGSCWLQHLGTWLTQSHLHVVVKRLSIPQLQTVGREAFLDRILSLLITWHVGRELLAAILITRLCCQVSQDEVCLLHSLRGNTENNGTWWRYRSERVVSLSFIARCSVENIQGNTRKKLEDKTERSLTDNSNHPIVSLLFSSPLSIHILHFHNHFINETFIGLICWKSQGVVITVQSVYFRREKMSIKTLL